MPYQNLQITFSDADRAATLAKIDELKALLPFLINLAKGEKRKRMQLGKKAGKFFIDVLDIISTSPEFKPPFVNRDDFAGDFDIYIALMALELKVKMLAEALTDTRVALEQEMIKPALAVYSSIQQAEQANVPGSTKVLEKLKVYFKKERKKKK